MPDTITTTQAAEYLGWPKEHLHSMAVYIPQIMVSRVGGKAGRNESNTLRLETVEIIRRLVHEGIGFYPAARIAAMSSIDESGRVVINLSPAKRS